MTRNILTISLDKEQFEAYHSGAMSGAAKDSLDAFVDRMRLIGHEAFILPPGEVKILGDEAEGNGDHAMIILNVDVGNMPPSKSQAYVNHIKDKFADHPLIKNMIFLARSGDGRGTEIKMFKV